MSVTMEKVAKKAKVSLKTVSRVVNDEGNVSLATKEKVIRVIRDLGFVPNSAARRLSRGKAMAIGLVLGWSIDTNYSSALIHNVSSACNEYNNGLSLFPSDENVVNQVMQACLGKQVDGILLDTIPALNKELKKQLDTIAIPYVVIHPSCMNEPCDASYVTIDDFESAKKAVRYLVELGHKSIGCISEITNFSQERDRINGYRDALANANIPFRESLVSYTHIGGMQGGYAAATKLVVENENLSAIFCLNDDMALGAMNAIWHLGRKVPDDISVIGFDDIRYASMVIPPLTTIRQPIDQIAKAAVKQIIKMVDDLTSERISVVMPTQLIIRETCKPYPDNS
jgi:DNA-binding LacI/PurR family transcriptional regulator